MENLLSYKDAAEKLGVCERTVWTLVKTTKKLQALNIGTRVLITPAALAEYIASRENETKGA